MSNLENEIIEQQMQSEQQESTTGQSALNSADPIQVIDLVIDAGKLVVDVSKDVVSSIAENIDISF
jgi:hypothetical protein